VTEPEAEILECVSGAVLRAEDVAGVDGPVIRRGLVDAVALATRQIDDDLDRQPAWLVTEREPVVRRQLDEFSHRGRELGGRDDRDRRRVVTAGSDGESEQ